MRTDRDAKFSRHQHHKDSFVQSTMASHIKLAHVYGAGLQHLLEHDPVLAVLAGGYEDWSDCFTNPRTAQDLIWTCWLLDPIGIELSKLPHRCDGFVDLPDLIGIHHQESIWANGITQDAFSPLVLCNVAADLLFDCGEALRNCLRGEPAHLFL